MKDDEMSTPSIVWFLKLIIAVLLTALPTIVVGVSLLYVRFVPTSWAGQGMLLSMTVFLIGAVALLFKKKTKYWGYSLGIGLMVSPATMLAAGVYYLSLIPLPVIGNAAYLLFAIIGIGSLIILAKWSSKNPVSRSTEKTGLITPSVKSHGSSIVPKLSWRQEQVAAAVELQEIPKSYAYQDSSSQPQEDMVPKFLSIVRQLSLTSVPFSLRFERRDNTTRVLFLTWAKDDTLLYHQKTVLQDTLEGNLHGFKFKSCGYYEGLELDGTLSAAAVEISGVPLSIEEESQRKDPMEVVAGILQGLENGLVQIFVEPAETNSSQLSSLESQFRQAVESSETTVTKEKSGLLSSERQESKRIVDPKAMRKAELLKRQLERVSGKNLCLLGNTILQPVWVRVRGIRIPLRCNRLK